MLFLAGAAERQVQLLNMDNEAIEWAVMLIFGGTLYNAFFG